MRFVLQAISCGCGLFYKTGNFQGKILILCYKRKRENDENLHF